MSRPSEFVQDFTSLTQDDIYDHAAMRKVENWRFVQILAVNVEDGLDLIYSFMKDGHLENNVVKGVARDAEIPSISGIFLEAFVFENEVHDLFGLSIKDIAIDFDGHFYDLAVAEPMTIISPEQRAAREKAKKVEAAKAAKAAKAAQSSQEEASESSEEGSGAVAVEPSPGKGEKAEASLEEKLANLPPEKAEKVRAALRAKEEKQGEAARDAKDGEQNG